ncbi:MAG: hypothetical protein UR23_C0052G0002 [Candidatus Roizmanbacteria bacterium GW2011_GWA2_32_13]|uniref:Uncharacterized protein n=1 Tax=Candidatus Roizmanbacteria bacterium GW2011_GWA2_32_13 TaxID=1618475 RepID=A0A0G0B245_9BACT|nr:MAG: hypothetical protein UR23_C0052G0002 [Candidatus Roizmanbacteria bacterium GW2011_GWA2_32_13]
MKTLCDTIKCFRSSIFAEYVPMFLIMTLLFLGALYLSDEVSKNVVWYGIPSKISISGDFRFYPSNKKGQLLDEHWFWAVPADINDTENIQNIYEILEPQGVYKITGIRDEDDCDYRGIFLNINAEIDVKDFPCVASLTILDIVRVGTAIDIYPVQYTVGGTYKITQHEVGGNYKVIDLTAPTLNSPL